MAAQPPTPTAHDVWGIYADFLDAPMAGVCAYHTDRTAQGTCAECQAAICLECLTTVEHRPICPACAGAAVGNGAPPLTTDDVVLRYSGACQPAAARSHAGRLPGSLRFAGARG